MAESRPNRLKELREARGLSTAKLGREIGVDGSFISRMENGSRRLGGDWVPKLAGALGVTEGELWREAAPALIGRDEPDDRPGTILIPEYDVFAAAGAGFEPQLVGGDAPPLVSEWVVPRQFLPAQYWGRTIVIISVQGDSMMPELRPEERVMVDTTQTFVGPEGIYVAWNGGGVVLKRMQLIPGDPAKVRFISANPAYEPYALPASEVRIYGRVIGRWEWR